MPTDGSGNYTPPSNSWNPAVAGTTISPTDWATLLTDLAQGLTDRLDADGSKTATADQPMGTYKHTNVGNAAARNQYLTVDQNQDGETVFAAATGSATSYLLTLTPAITVYATGMTVNFAVPVTNTGAVSLNINSVGTTASTITRYGLTLQAGALTAGDLASVMYTGTGWNLMSPQKGPGTAYTPVLAFGGASVGITYTLQEGFYTVMGRWVLFSATIILSNKGSSTGDATLTLPLTSSSTPSVG
jgi:hypothetical protein